MKHKHLAPLVVLGSLHLLACNATPDAGQARQPVSAESQLEQPTSGGVELNTNYLRGTVRFTNQNADILAFFAENYWNTASITARSTAPTGYSASTSSVTFINPAEFTFELLVEAGAGGASGVAYEVTGYRGTHSLPTYQNAIVKPPDQGPTQITIDRCLGEVQFTLGEDDTCSAPVTATAVSTNSFSVYKRQGLYDGFVPAGFNQSITVNYTASDATGSFSNSTQIPIAAACDEIVSVCIPVQRPPPPPPPPSVGSVTGPWELIGEPSISSRTCYLQRGPTNIGKSIPAGPAPESDPSTWWKFTDIPEGSGYLLYTWINLRTGRDYTEAVPANQSSDGVVVANQATSFAKVIDGELRYPLVMRPAYFYGAVTLADPYTTGNSGSRSTLQSLFFSADAAPPAPSLTSGTYLTARGGSGFSKSSFPHSFNPVTGSLSSAYELVLPSEYNLPASWSQDLMVLRFWSEGSDFKTRPGLYDPATFANGSLELRPQRNIGRVFQPGERYRSDQEYCFNELQLDYWTALGTLFNPVTAVQGSFSNVDWQGHQVNYVVSGQFGGMPAVLGYPNPASYATAQGTTRMTLPQGTYTLSPAASLVNSSGQVNTANFAPISLQLGCGQRLKIVPPLTVSIAPMNGCAQSASSTVSGIVKSSPASVDRIYYRLNGGPEITYCTQCGVNPTFSFTVPLQACGNEVQVLAFSEGMPDAAVGYQQITWDDASDGPSCTGTFCVNRPPVARCSGVTAPASATCGGSLASVNDGSYDPDPGDTFSCVQTPGGPYEPGTQQVTLTCMDALGLSSSCEATVTVLDETPPVLNCPASPQACPADGNVSEGVTASDNCSAAPAVACSRTGDEATCTATDAAGNHASCSFTCSACSKLGLSDYNLFLLEDYTGGHDVQGKVAAGGDISMTDFAVGSGLPDSDISRALVAGGNLTLSRGGVWGDTWYGGSYTSDPSVALVRGTASQGAPIDFAARGAQLRALSAQLAGLAPNGSTTRESWGGLMLHGTSTNVNVFDVNSSAFTGAALLSIDAPAGSLAVLNIHGSSATFTGFGHSFTGGIDQHGILYNFVDATEINAHGYGFWGTVLAPLAHITFNDGSFDGGIYARSLTGNAEGHLNALQDRDVCEAQLASPQDP